MTSGRPDPGDAPAADGRHARKDRNRDAVVRAMVEYLAEGDPRPTAVMVAERSGVSLRSVFRYFEDLDSLLTTALTQFTDQLEPVLRFEQPPPGTPLDERIDRIVAFRSVGFPQFARALNVAHDRARTSPTVREQLESYRRDGSAILAELFAPEIEAAGDDGTMLLGALHSAVLPEVWVNAMDRHELDAAQSAEVMRRLLRGALGLHRA